MGEERRGRPKRLSGEAERRPGKPKQHTPKEASQEEKPSTVILEGVKKVGAAARKKKGKEVQSSGLSLGVKFALVITIVSAALCFFAGLFAYFQTEKELLFEIDRKGAAMVKAVGCLAEQYYRSEEKALRYENTVKELQNTKAGLEKEREEAEEAKNERQKKVLEAKIQEAQDRIDQMRKEFPSKKELKENFLKYLDQLVFYYVEKKKLFSDEIINVAFIRPESDQKFTILLHSGEALEFTGSQARLSERIKDTWYDSPIQVMKGTMSSDKGKVIRARAYRLPVIPDQLEAMVTLSEKDIRRTLDAIFFGILMTTLVAIGIGTCISFLLARHVTSPVRQLIQDIEIVAEGNLNHNTVATSKDEIGILAYTFNVMTKNLKIAHGAELEQQAREHELQIATEIQANLLPSQIPKMPGYEIAAYYHPAKEVGGDYYDFIEIDQDHFGFIVADVSGKSIPGSMVMAMARALFRMETGRNTSPAKTFIEVNRVLAQDIRKGMFVTAMYGILGIKSGELWISSAGHNPAVIWKKDKKEIQLANPKGMALGLDKGKIFEKTVRDEKYQLQPGDRVVFYTDGVVEAMSPQNEEFSEDKFTKLIGQEAAQSSNQLVNVVVQALEGWRKNSPQSDDITIVTFKKL